MTQTRAQRDGSHEDGAEPTTTRRTALLGMAGLAAASLSAGGWNPLLGADAALTLAGKPPAADDPLRLAYPNDPDTINAVTGSDTVSEAFQRFVYEPLANRQYADPDQWENFLAESYTFDEKTLEFTIQLRKGVKWHPMKLPDGTPLPETDVTARDVKFTFDCILNTFVEAAHFRSYYEDPNAAKTGNKFRIKVSTSRKDKYQVKIQWTEPYFLAKEFTLAVPIIPQHVYSVDKKGEPISFDFASEEFGKGFNDHWANRSMCGTGPMMFAEWEREQKFQLIRNPNYWGKPFFFSKMDYRCIANPTTAVKTALAGDLDFNPVPEKDVYLQAKDNPNVVAGKVLRREFDYPAYRYIGYNLRRGDFLKDAKVRTALGHAVPVDQIIAQVFKGLAIRCKGPFPPTSPGLDPTIEPLAFDLTKANALLDEAGWKQGADGWRTKTVDGKESVARYDLLVYSDSPSFQTIGEIVKENSRRIGVDVQISPVKWSLFLQKLRKKEFDACMLGWAMPWQQDPYQIWHSSQADVPESSNAIGYANKEVDALIEELRKTLDSKKQIELYRKIHARIFADQPYTFLFCEKQTVLQNARIENVNFYAIRPCYDAREWFSRAKP